MGNQIKYSEFTNQNKWTREGRELFCPNVTKIIDGFNSINEYINYSIVKEDKVVTRIKIITFWINVLSKSFKIFDYTTSMIIVFALKSAPIARLQQTWSNVPFKVKNKWKKFANLMNFNNGYEAIRNLKKNNCSSEYLGRKKKNFILIFFFNFFYFFYFFYFLFILFYFIFYFIFFIISLFV